MKPGSISITILLFLVIASLPVAEPHELGQLLGDLNATLQWDPLSEIGYLDIPEGGEYGSGRVIFRINTPWILLDYQHLIATAGIQRREGRIIFPSATVAAIKGYLTEKLSRQKAPRVAVILIDPGHGGKDSGAIGYHLVSGKTITIQEKDVVLKVAGALHRRLQEAYPDKKVFMTRNGDTYLRLEERTEIANSIPIGRQEAIIFISIHANASFNKNARGFEVWYLPANYRRKLIDPETLEEDTREIAPILNVLLEEEYTLESITLAREIIAGFEQTVGNETENRGIKEESWFVVRNAKMPSVLIELGFITNQEEALKLNREEYLQKLTEGIYTGIRNFVRNFERTKGFTE